MAFNIVEAIAEPEDCAFDQRCKFGHRVEGHAVYCHNDNWDDYPRKCRRTWYTNGKVKDEDCPGFEANPKFTGTLSPTPLSGQLCSKCKGRKLIETDRGRRETCPLCMGNALEPHAMPLSVFEQDTLELCASHSGTNPGQYARQVRIAQSKEDSESMWKLDKLELIQIHSMSFGGKVTVYLYSLTGKGDAVMHANWHAPKLPS